MKIGERIRTERESRDPPISRAQLARESGVPYPTLAGIENGDQDSSTRLHDIAQALGVNAKWLETGKGPKLAVTPPPASYHLGFSFEKIIDAQKLLREYSGIANRPASIVEDPRWLRLAYKIVDEDSRQEKPGQVVDLMKQLSAAFKEDREEEAHGDQRREAEGTGKAAGGNRARRTGKA